MAKTGLWGATLLAVALACPGVEAQTRIPPSPSDFAMMAAQSDQYEILAAQVAEVQGRDARVRAFAGEIMRDHTRLDGDLRHAVGAAGLPPLEPSLSADQASLLGALQSLRGADFDKAYARQQILAHSQAAAVEDSFATAGSEPNLKEAARSALPVIRDHLQKAQQLHADLGPS